jgi:hypothetical protein
MERLVIVPITAIIALAFLTSSCSHTAATTEQPVIQFELVTSHGARSVIVIRNHRTGHYKLDGHKYSLSPVLLRQHVMLAIDDAEGPSPIHVSDVRLGISGVSSYSHIASGFQIRALKVYSPQ